MGFLCPDCTRETLRIIKKIELPSDSRSDEISLQVIQCNKCGLLGVAIYEESRRGSLISESYSHIGYLLPEEIMDAVIQAIEKCPDVRNTRCKCSSHKYFHKLDGDKRWSWINNQSPLKSFQMNLS